MSYKTGCERAVFPALVVAAFFVRNAGVLLILSALVLAALSAT